MNWSTLSCCWKEIHGGGFTVKGKHRGEFINGCRLVYPMEKEAMRFLNLLANKFFGVFFLIGGGATWGTLIPYAALCRYEWKVSH